MAPHALFLQRAARVSAAPRVLLKRHKVQRPQPSALCSRPQSPHAVFGRACVVLCCAGHVYTASAVAQDVKESILSIEQEFFSVGTTDAKHSTPQDLVPPTYITAPGRIVSIGDLHGDMAKAQRSLELAGVMQVVDERPVWTGGDTVLVQLGDVLDRGDSEIAIVMLLRELHEQAQVEGGGVYMLNGNHESLNIAGDYRYVTDNALIESALAAGLTPGDIHTLYREVRNAPQRKQRLAKIRDRVYGPGMPMALELSRNPTVLVVNDTVFAHGGLLPTHVAYGLERINAEVAAWMRGELDPYGDLPGDRVKPPFLAMGNADSVMWSRTFSRERWNNPIERFHACALLRSALDAIGAKRLVVGHTPQLAGCNSECDGRVWRIDVGMSSGVLNADAQVLQIIQDPVVHEAVVSIIESVPLTGTIDEEAMFEL